MSHQKVAPYNFFSGQPATELLPAHEIMEATIRILKRFDKTMDDYNGSDDHHPLNYGTDPGNLQVRRIIAKWNDQNFKLPTPTDPDCINLDSGASYGVMNLLSQFASPQNGVTRRAFLVSPTYFLINSAFIDAGFGGKLTAVRQLDDGQIDLDQFAQTLEYYDSLSPPPKTTITKEDIPAIYDPYRPIKRIFRYIMYLVPTFSNPMGWSLSDETKLGLIELARKHDMLIVTDDVYDLLDYRGVPDRYKRMVHLDRQTLPAGNKYGNVLSNATFSKLIGPGLRAGYQESATPELAFLVSQGGAHKSGGSPSQLNTVIVGELIKTGTMDDQIEQLKAVYSARAQAFKDCIPKYLPKGTKATPIDGGYFFWVTLPDEYDLEAIDKECSENGVILATGGQFEVTGDELGWGKHCIRLSVSHLSVETIEKGMAIWGEICSRHTI